MCVCLTMGMTMLEQFACACAWFTVVCGVLIHMSKYVVLSIVCCSRPPPSRLSYGSMMGI